MADILQTTISDAFLERKSRSFDSNLLKFKPTENNCLTVKSELIGLEI